ncbi:MAG: sensor domain-containing diguanylate cyclase [Sterolibacterium sp.]
MMKPVTASASADGGRITVPLPPGEIPLAAKIVETSREGIMVCDTETRIVWVNPAFTEITGFTAAEAIGATPRILQSDDMYDRLFYDALWSSLVAIGHWQGEVWSRKKNGNVFPEWLNLQAIVDEHGVTIRYVGTFSDLSEQQGLQKSLYRLAYFDSVTGLPNRNLFHDRLQQALLQATREKSALAVLFLDLDRFKDVNDSLGHDAGDRLLKAAAERIAGCMREGDTLSRLGGDEFAAILPNAGDAPAVAQVAGRIIQSLSFHFNLVGREVSITASVGISLFPSDGKEAETLIENADIAMYQAKEGSGNGYRFFDREMHALPGRIGQRL